jgi:hypothetical protein
MNAETKQFASAFTGSHTRQCSASAASFRGLERTCRNTRASLDGINRIDTTGSRRRQKGKKTKKTLDLTFDSALTFGDWDINENWRKYRNAFLREKQ